MDEFDCDRCAEIDDTCDKCYEFFMSFPYPWEIKEEV